MRKMIVSLTLLGSLLTGGVANAGIYADDMARCLVRSTSASDQQVLMRWIFAMFASNPAVADMAKVTPAEREASSRRAADLMQRLVYVDCRKETVAALKYEGKNVFETSFGLLGQVAVRGLFTDPSTQAEMKAFATHFDAAKMKALAAEVGDASLAPPESAPKSTTK